MLLLKGLMETIMRYPKMNYFIGPVSISRNPKNKYQHFCDYFNDVAEISAAGTFTAKKPGESIVLATALNGDKELFAVRCGG